MSEADLAARGAPPENDSIPLGSDLVWGVASIALEISKTQRQTFHMLENGNLPAKKIGGRWCSTRSALRHHFAMPSIGEVA
jgi:hypothetical protein